MLNQLDGQFYSVTLLCETPGLGIKRCEYNVETVLFIERHFDAQVYEDGQIHVETGINNDNTFPMFGLVGLMFLMNIIYAAKVALEMNLGFSPCINTLEFIHILIVEVALLCFMYR